MPVNRAEYTLRGGDGKIFPQEGVAIKRGGLRAKRTRGKPRVKRIRDVKGYSPFGGGKKDKHRNKVLKKYSKETRVFNPEREGGGMGGKGGFKVD